MGKDSLTEKSRETGATYIYLGTYIHYWLFTEGFEALVFSLKREDVDDRTPSSLFGKIRYMVDSLPFWILPVKYNKRIHLEPFMRLINPDNNNSIIGRATTEDSGRSGRKSAVLIDEYAGISPRLISGMESALQEVTNTIHRVSTPKGINQFKIVRDKKICDVHTFHWTQIPPKCEGLYYLNPKGKRVDCPDLPTERRSPYGYLIDPHGNVTKLKLRSIWYDKQCKRYINSRDRAQELDISYTGSGFGRFTGEMLEEKSKLVRDGKRGYLIESGGQIKFVETTTGEDYELEVWKFPTRPYFQNRSVIAADTAEGLEKGDANSADVLQMNDSGTKIFHAAALHGRWTPDIFADKLDVLGRWYDGGCEIAVERNKDGLGVLLRLQNQLDYNNLYCDRVQGETEADKPTNRLGFLTSQIKKFTITADVDEAFRNDEITSYSINHFTEMSTFLNKDGKLGADKSNFDDRVMSLCIGYHVIKQYGRPSLKDRRKRISRRSRRITAGY